MRAKITMLLTVFTLLLGGMLAVASPAAAAPAQPYNVAECFEFTDYWTGDVYSYCYEAKGVSQFNESASGNIKFTANAKYSYELSLNGETVYAGSGSYHFTEIVKPGGTQVVHYLGRGEDTFLGVTCTYSTNFVYANGEVRHDVYDFQCS